jgi:hypothetical protein
MAGSVIVHRAAPWAQPRLLASHATGHASLVGYFIWAETVGIILTRGLLLCPQVSLANRGSGHGKEERDQNERGCHMHCDGPLLLKDAADGDALTAVWSV